MKLSLFDAIKMLSMEEAQIVQFVCQKRVGMAKGAAIAPVVTQLFAECDTHDLAEVQEIVANLEQAENQAP